MSDSQKNQSYSWVELCSDVAPFGSAAFTLLLWKGWKPQSSICFPLWNQSHDPICHFWETAAALARGSRKGRQKNIICNSRILPERRKSSSLKRQEFYPKEAPEWAGLAVTAVSPLLWEENVTPGVVAHSHTAVCSWHSRLCSVCFQDSQAQGQLSVRKLRVELRTRVTSHSAVNPALQRTAKEVCTVSIGIMAKANTYCFCFTRD